MEDAPSQIIRDLRDLRPLKRLRSHAVPTRPLSLSFSRKRKVAKVAIVAKLDGAQSPHASRHTAKVADVANQSDHLVADRPA